MPTMSNYWFKMDLLSSSFNAIAVSSDLAIMFTSETYSKAEFTLNISLKGESFSFLLLL